MKKNILVVMVLICSTALAATETAAPKLTADQQSEGSASDVELTRKIRQQLNKDRSFSINGQNVKIITVAGITTLRGPVKNSSEKSKIAQVARGISGTNNVINELEVVQK